MKLAVVSTKMNAYTKQISINILKQLKRFNVVKLAFHLKLKFSVSGGRIIFNALTALYWSVVMDSTCMYWNIQNVSTPIITDLTSLPKVSIIDHEHASDSIS